eukprot:COSAG05_NODE_17559_length_323_cov_0.852679_1_plen_107_part_11
MMMMMMQMQRPPSHASQQARQPIGTVVREPVWTGSGKPPVPETEPEIEAVDARVEAHIQLVRKLLDSLAVVKFGYVAPLQQRRGADALGAKVLCEDGQASSLEKEEE